MIGVGPPGPVSLKVVVLIVAGFIALLNVATMVWLEGTFRAPLAGIVDVTTGETLSGPAPVVNIHGLVAPGTRNAPPVSVTVGPIKAVKVVFGARAAAG